MFSWIEKAFSCCSTRMKPQQIDRCIEAKVEKPEFIDESTMFPSNALFQIPFEVALIEPKNSDGSTASSKKSAQSLPELESIIALSPAFLCKICKKASEGFCTACADSKFCKNCFEELHFKLPDFHRFSRYKQRSEYGHNNSQMKSLAKLFMRHNSEKSS